MVAIAPTMSAIVTLERRNNSGLRFGGKIVKVNHQWPSLILVILVNGINLQVKVMADTIRVFVDLGPHVKRFGTGWRIVDVLKLGTKWAYVQSSPCAIRKPTPTGRVCRDKRKRVPLFIYKTKVLRKVWDKLPKKEL